MTLADAYAIFEIELNDINEQIALPTALEVIKEVTDDVTYRNSTLAKTQSLN